jgi:Kelch motif protein
MNADSHPPRWLVGALLSLFVSAPLCVALAAAGPERAGSWVTVVATSGRPTPREECAFIEDRGLFYLIGGRGINPVDIFDPRLQAWSRGAPPPIEIHHFQPVIWGGRIYVACAMTGNYPTERPVGRVLIYDPATDSWVWGPAIPVRRRRGSAGAVVHDGSLILVCGIINGHTDGWVNWCDSYDFRSDTWSVLPNAPRARDHFEAAVIGQKIYVAGGRRSSAITKQVFDLTIPEIDVFAFATQTWSTLPVASDLPLPRAGANAAAVGPDLIVCGGESMAQTAAHAEVQALNTTTGTWRNLPSLQRGRHGTGLVFFDGIFYTCAGAGDRGGKPLLSTMEMLPWAPMISR